MEVIADREISGNMIPFPVKYRKRDFFSIKYKKRLKAIPHKEAPTDESVGGFAAGRSPHKSFKSSDKVCDTDEKITRLRKP